MEEVWSTIHRAGIKSTAGSRPVEQTGVTWSVCADMQNSAVSVTFVLTIVYRAVCSYLTLLSTGCLLLAMQAA